MKLLLDTHVFLYIHKDPFDRLLIAQSNVESMNLVSIDEKIEKYSVVVIN